ncbi:hypothetical protein [Catenuloplanes atrovinosus]|uniref:DUF1579 domain-containing protein n=1 Tax=Catenuloplanes atrovinosus TaxID=137266 RepID=A0AAE3YQN2_9ACTN|nr:hypothetical protein [Catenuloplanes atrovinosus]MDR7276549.1 hypothetical protein [Catenuloplanes atrovinosus]
MDDGRADFDFIFGDWRVRNRRIRDNADPECTEWVEFDATAHAEPILGGLGHIDRITAEDPPFEGLTLRQFDPEARVWRIWWASSRRPGHLDPPLEGAWRDGRGVFEGDDVVGGRPVRLRFEWTTDGADAARWQQEFSWDGGRTWRLNWVMELSRTGAA